MLWPSGNDSNSGWSERKWNWFGFHGKTHTHTYREIKKEKETWKCTIESIHRQMNKDILRNYAFKLKVCSGVVFDASPICYAVFLYLFILNESNELSRCFVLQIMDLCGAFAVCTTATAIATTPPPPSWERTMAYAASRFNNEQLYFNILANLWMFRMILLSYDGVYMCTEIWELCKILFFLKKKRAQQPNSARINREK